MRTAHDAIGRVVGRNGAERIHRAVFKDHVVVVVYKTALTEAERLTVQGYLMAKWLGDCNGTYSDLTGATVTGGDGLALQMEDGRFDAGLSVTGSSLVLCVKSVGTMVIFR